MENTKNIGICMDHAAANFIDLNALEKQQTISSKFTYELMDEAIRKNKNLGHNKLLQMQQAYYKEVVLRYLNTSMFFYLGL